MGIVPMPAARVYNRITWKCHRQ